MHGGGLLSRTYDVVVVGSGINGLACAALLSRAGRSVCVLERNDWFGGAIKTDEITLPGYKHDVFSAWHPLWVGGAVHPQLADDLARHGLEYLNTDLPTATLFRDGESAFLLRTADENAAELDRHHAGDGDAWRAALEDADAPAALREQRPARERVDPAPDDDGVVVSHGRAPETRRP